MPGPPGMIDADAVAGHAQADCLRELARERCLRRAPSSRRRSSPIWDRRPTDLIPIRNGKVAARGYSDAERMAHGELVYAGVVRSFLMAGLRLVPFRGRWVPLMNEWFANMSDVYRILGELPEGADVMATADQRDKSVAASRARVARQIGRDATDASPQAFAHLPASSRRLSCERLSMGRISFCRMVEFSGRSPLIGAGVGRFSSGAWRSGRASLMSISAISSRAPPRFDRRLVIAHRLLRGVVGHRLTPETISCGCGIISDLLDQPLQASRSSGPAVFSTAILSWSISCSILSRGRIISRLARMTDSSTAALARFSPRRPCMLFYFFEAAEESRALGILFYGSTASSAWESAAARRGTANPQSGQGPIMPPGEAAGEDRTSSV